MTFLHKTSSFPARATQTIHLYQLLCFASSEEVKMFHQGSSTYLHGVVQSPLPAGLFALEELCISLQLCLVTDCLLQKQVFCLCFCLKIPGGKKQHGWGTWSVISDGHKVQTHPLSRLYVASGTSFSAPDTMAKQVGD